MYQKKIQLLYIYKLRSGDNIDKHALQWTSDVSLVMAARHSYAGHSVLLLIFLSYFLLLFRRLILEVAWPIVTKLCHMFDGDHGLQNTSKICGALPEKIWWRKTTSKFRCDSVQLRNLIANISGTKQDIVHRKTALQTTITPAQAYLIWWTLVHKRRKTRP